MLPLGHGSLLKRYFHFTVLPFGIAAATYIFMKVLREFIKVWRRLGLHTVIYVDDGIDAEDTFEEADRVTFIIHTDLVASGWVPHKDKCVWAPQRVLDWLGNTWDLTRFRVSATGDRIRRVKEVLESIVMHVPGISVRQLARVSGNLIALELSFGDIVHLRSKAMQMMIASGSHWDAVVPWSAGALEEVQFWKDHLEGLNGMSLEPAIAAGVVSYSDASSVAAAAIISPGPCKEVIVVHHTFGTAAK